METSRVQNPGSQKIQVIPNGKDQMLPALFLCSAYCLYDSLLIKTDVQRFPKDSYRNLVTVLPNAMSLSLIHQIFVNMVWK